MQQKCQHKWRSKGLWDGVDENGKITGGQLYVCDLCSEESRSLKDIQSKGGEIIKNVDIYGNDIK
jgi:hypothetical protein